MTRLKIAFLIAASTAAGLLSIYSIIATDLYHCDDAIRIGDDRDAIAAAKKFIELRHAENKPEFREIMQSSDFSSDKFENGVGWTVSRAPAGFFVNAEVRMVEFSGRDGSSVSCVVLKCGRVFGCEDRP
ncbi:hypothetical protein [Methylosinus sporium]|uniref:hypothetical protein n=1 Tax=Methylosinus sporium TaxID=428 RepID=UPI00383ACACD